MKVRHFVIAAVVLALGVGGAVLWRKAGRSASELDAVRETRCVSLPVNLSKMGHYSAVFEQTYCGSHSQTLVLEVDPVPGPSSAPWQWMAGLKGRMGIVDAAGAAVVEGDIPEGGAAEGPDGSGRIVLAEFRPPDKGRYQFQFEITSPAGATPRGRQVLTLRYALCGLEYSPAEMLRLGAWAMFGLAGLIGLVTGIWLVRRRNRPSAAAQETSKTTAARDHPAGRTGG